jgi:hypothetical protein
MSMPAVVNEIRLTNTYTDKNGVTVVIHNVPTKILTDEFGTEYESHSIAVAMRLDELTNKALFNNQVSGTTIELEF